MLVTPGDATMRYFEHLSRVGGWLPTDGGMQLTSADGMPLLRVRAQD